MTPSSFSLVSKEHLQLSYLCASFLFLRLLPMGSESYWFFLCNSFLIPTVLSSPTAIPLILSSFSPGWAIPYSSPELGPPPPPHPPRLSRMSSTPIMATFCSRTQQSPGSKAKWPCRNLWTPCGQVPYLCTAPAQLLEHLCAQYTCDDPLLIPAPPTFPISSPEAPLVTPPDQRRLPTT